MSLYNFSFYDIFDFWVVKTNKQTKKTFTILNWAHSKLMIRKLDACFVIRLLQFSLQMSYSVSFRLLCFSPTAFMCFQCTGKFTQGKHRCCHSKTSKFCPLNRNYESFIVINNHEFEHMLTIYVIFFRLVKPICC